MNKKLLYLLWAGLFILCACCGFIPQPEGPLVLLMTICPWLMPLLPSAIL